MSLAKPDIPLVVCQKNNLMQTRRQISKNIGHLAVSVTASLTAARSPSIWRRHSFQWSNGRVSGQWRPFFNPDIAGVRSCYGDLILTTATTTTAGDAKNQRLWDFILIMVTTGCKWRSRMHSKISLQKFAEPHDLYQRFPNLEASGGRTKLRTGRHWGQLLERIITRNVSVSKTLYQETRCSLFSVSFMAAGFESASQR